MSQVARWAVLGLLLGCATSQQPSGRYLLSPGAARNANPPSPAADALFSMFTSGQRMFLLMADGTCAEYITRRQPEARTGLLQPAAGGPQTAFAFTYAEDARGLS